MEPIPSTGKKRSVVLVTNSLQFLKHPKVSKIIVLQDGRVVEQGSFTELSRQNTLFSRFLSVISESSSQLRNSSVKAESEANTLGGPSRDAKKKELLATGVAKTMTEETRLTGHVSLSVYWSWAKAAGGIVVPFIVFITFALGEGLQVLSNWFLTYWSGHAGATTQTHFLFIYAAINLCAASADTVRILAVIAFSLVASRELFAGMLASVLHAPMSFFDTTPIGRLVNRFSKGKCSRSVKMFPFVHMRSI
jgi:ABC-type multidrug transport system fused ATPase/permease subunit